MLFPIEGCVVYFENDEEIVTNIQKTFIQRYSAELPKIKFQNLDDNYTSLFMIVDDSNFYDVLNKVKYTQCILVAKNPDLASVKERLQIDQKLKFAVYNTSLLSFNDWFCELVASVLWPTVSIVYATEKGSTKTFAKKLSDTFEKNNIRHNLYRGSDKQPELFFMFDTMLILLISTFRKGSVPTDCVKIQEYLEETYKEKNLVNSLGVPISFAVCGFGTSHHEFTYCKASHTMKNLFLNLNANMVLDHHFVDYASEEHFQVFENAIIKLILDKYPKFSLTTVFSKREESIYCPSSMSKVESVEYQTFESCTSKVFDTQIDNLATVFTEIDNVEYGYVPLKLNYTKQLCKQISDTVSTVEANFLLPDHLTYLPLKDVNLKSVNFFPAVYWLLSNHIILPQSTSYSTPLYNIDKCIPEIPSYTTVFDSIAYYCDLSVLVTLPWIKYNLKYIQNPSEKALLVKFLAKEAEAAKLLDHYKISLFEILNYIIPSYKIPLVDFLRSAKRLVDRTYSISSYPSEDPHSISFVISYSYTELPDVDFFELFHKDESHDNNTVIQKTEKVINRKIHGLMSSLFCYNFSCYAPSILEKFIEKFNNLRLPLFPTIFKGKFLVSSFQLPKINNDIILIAASSGVGPMRVIWQHLQSLNTSNKIHLFFGCRWKNIDWLYKEEVMKMKEIFETVICTSSRDGAEKRYIDSDMRLHETLFQTVVSNGGQIYVCGSPRFVGTVTSVLENFISNYQEILASQIFVEEYS